MVKDAYFPKTSKIEMLIYSSGGICNLRCIYCNSVAKRSTGSWDSDIDLSLLYETFKKRNMLSEQFHLDYAPGEPSLHRQKTDYYRLFSEAGSVTVMTNATIYDNDLAENLRRGNSNLLISLDAGTKGTYKAVRGVDLYEKVLNNIKRYNECKVGCVDLKYIFVPGFNDSVDDVNGFVEFCDNIRPGSVFISYDMNNKIKTMPEKTLSSLRVMINSLESKNIIWKNMSDIIAKELYKF